MVTPEQLYRAPNALSGEYTRFAVAERLLLSGHSHQAWPDCGFEAQAQAWLDAARYVDDKWEHAFAQAARVREGYARLLDDTSGLISLGENTHNLVVRWLSALPLAKRPRLVTTDGEFHSLRRQTDRLREEPWVEIVKVPATPVEAIAERLCEAVDGRTSAVMVSAVLFGSARIVPGLDRVMEACRRHGAELLVDAYHALGAIPFTLGAHGLEDAYVTGGGYKYLQLGEGNCFLRFPENCEMRPVITGWYAEFDALTAKRTGHEVAFGHGPNRFLGGTYDPASSYRAAAVFDFFARKGLTPEVLREVSQHQVGLLRDTFDGLDLDPAFIDRDRDVALGDIAGFLTLRSPRAGELCAELKKAGVYTDSRGDILRMGPAPYLHDGQVVEAMEKLGVVCRTMAG